MNETTELERYSNGKLKRKQFWINGKNVSRSRYVMEQVLGRKLRGDEIVHHINGNTMDDRPENLQVMIKGKHSILHHKGAKRSEKTSQRISEALQHRSKEVRRRAAEKIMGDKHPGWKGDAASPETKYMRKWRRRRREALKNVE